MLMVNTDIQYSNGQQAFFDYFNNAGDQRFKKIQNLDWRNLDWVVDFSRQNQHDICFTSHHIQT